MKEKKNIFRKFLSAIGNIFKTGFLWIQYFLLFIFVNPFIKSKVKGKKNLLETDEARVFIVNHYELFGPVAMFLRFPYKFRPWVIDRIMNPESVEKQMSISVYNNFKRFPMWFKKLSVKALKNLMVFTMKHAKAIAVSKDNPRENLLALKESSITMQNGVSIVIFPELSYVESGVGEFQTGFEHLAKYHHQKTGQKVTFYPIFISRENGEMYIEKPIIYNPNNDPNEEKQNIVAYLRNAMLDSYIINECAKPYKKAKKIKIKRK